MALANGLRASFGLAVEEEGANALVVGEEPPLLTAFFDFGMGVTLSRGLGEIICGLLVCGLAVIVCVADETAEPVETADADFVSSIATAVVAECDGAIFGDIGLPAFPREGVVADVKCEKALLLNPRIDAPSVFLVPAGETLSAWTADCVCLPGVFGCPVVTGFLLELVL